MSPWALSRATDVVSQQRSNITPCKCPGGEAVGSSGKTDPTSGEALRPRFRTEPAGRADTEGDVAVMVILNGQMITDVSGAEWTLLKFGGGRRNVPRPAESQQL